MGAHRPAGRQVERIWGRRGLPAAFAPAVEGPEPIGEIWFEDQSDSDSDRPRVDCFFDELSKHTQGHLRYASDTLQSSPNEVH